MSEIILSGDILSSKYGLKDKEHILLQSVLHTSKIPDKSIWPELFDALNQWFKVPKDKLDVIRKLIHLVQATSNTLNDVAENAAERKGSPTASTQYSKDDALNSGYYCCFLTLEKLKDIGGYDGVQFGNEFFMDLSMGFGMAAYWRDHLICPTEEAYTKMGIRITGGIIRLTVRMMQLFSENKADFNKLVDIFGKFFHFYDDYVSLYSMDEYLFNKNGTENISEGKFNFPLIHAIKSEPKDVQLINILRLKPTEPEVIKYVVALLEKFGSLTYTKQTLKKLREEADEEMKKFEKNPQITQIFDKIFSKLEIN